MEKIILSSISAHLKSTQIVSNLARQKMLILTLCALLKSRSVVLSELAVHLNDSVKTDSNETRVDGIWGSVLVSKDAKGELLFLFAYRLNVRFLDQFYRKRWTIETIFQAFKFRGFNLEDTHLKINERLKKTHRAGKYGLCFLYLIRCFRHENEKVVKNKKQK